MKTKFWVDFENAPHIPVLLPIVRKLEARGYEPVMTARNFSFTAELIEKHGLSAKLLGKGSASKSSLGKALRVLQRVLLLRQSISPGRSELAFSIAHASRSMLIASHIMGITSVSLEDYEHSSQFHNSLSNLLLVPEPIPFEAFPKNKGRILHYPGIKENIYLEGLQLPRVIPEFISEKQGSTKLLFRPEGRTAHYRSSASQAIQISVLERLKKTSGICLFIYPRDKIQKQELASFLEGGKADYVFPPIIDGPDLISSVDAVIGGGGTMTREAALLGVPSYSFFSGEWGAVDEYLVKQGRLVRMVNPEDASKIVVERRESGVDIPHLKTTGFIVDELVSLGN